MTEEMNVLVEYILVVEDNPDHARLIIKTLKDSGHLLNEIIHLKNGEEAISFLKKEGKFRDEKRSLPMLILLDLKMPLKNGFDVLKEIKRDVNLRCIPVIMLTTSSRTEDIQTALSLGANDFIVKPFKFPDFSEKLAKVGCYWVTVSNAKSAL